MLSGIDLFRVAADRMRYLTERQSVIGRNVANADTPGYKALDVTPFVPGAPAQGQLALTCTQPGHIAPASNSTVAPQTVAASLYGEKPDGNSVSIEEQMVKSADVANAFSLASAAYAKGVSLMKISIDSGR
jgi:flagellar basal-body rod protein FlgB